MEIQFVIGREVYHNVFLNTSMKELFHDTKNYSNISNNNIGKFKIPLAKDKKFDVTESDEDSEMDSFEDSLDDLEEKFNIKNEINLDNKKSSRRGKISDLESHFLELPGDKKTKKGLTEDEQAKKNEQAIKRKLHTQRLVEEEKRLTIEKILNEAGKKLKERERKNIEMKLQKEQQKEEYLKVSLTKIKHKYEKNGKIFVRFPKGLLLPKALSQKPIILNIEKKWCQVKNCKKQKKYKDPKTKLDYCSLECYHKIKEQHIKA